MIVQADQKIVIPPGVEVRRRQRIDGDIALQESNGLMIPPDLSLDEMLRQCLWLAEGDVVGYIGGQRPVFIGYREFRNLTSAAATLAEGKLTPTAILWQRHPRRRSVMTRTFRPGAAEICLSPDGLSAVNTWRPLSRPALAGDPSLFLEHLAYLIPENEEREAFLNWLAHIEQRPGVLPHFGWLHVAEHTGTGRNWLASVLARVWQGYVAPNVDLSDLLESQFNGQLAGRILAIVDEVQTDAESGYRQENRLKSLINAEIRQVNPKFGRTFSEINACRWLVFSNHQNALPINNNDRRWRAVLHTRPPRSPESYRKLYTALDDLRFIEAVAGYLARRDIADFNPGERPPMSDAKRSVIDAGKSLMLQRTEELVAHWPGDLISNRDAAAVLSDDGEDRITPAMRRALAELGGQPLGRTVRIDGRVERVWMLRNVELWRLASIDAVRDGLHAVRTRPGATAPLNVPATEWLAEATEHGYRQAAEDR